MSDEQMDALLVFPVEADTLCCCYYLYRRQHLPQGRTVAWGGGISSIIIAL
jgi:hypothetical protein